MKQPGGIVMRLLGRRGAYPSYPIASAHHVLVADQHLAWSAVRQPEREYDGRTPEVSWLHREEVRFFSSLSLTEAFPNSYGYLLAEPWTHGTLLEDTGQLLDSPEFLEWGGAHAKGLLEEATTSDYLVPQPRTAYHFRDRGTADHVFDILKKIDASDDLLLRGLSKFQTAACLMRLAPFLEEAAVTAFVSREAAFLIIKQHLEATTARRVTLEDVIKHIRELFPTGQPFADVLESDYEARLMLVHPVTQFGVYWCPPVFREQCYDAVKTLIHLYRFILLSEVWSPTDDEE